LIKQEIDKERLPVKFENMRCCGEKPRPLAQSYKEVNPCKEQIPISRHKTMIEQNNACGSCDSIAHERRRMTCNHIMCIRCLKLFHESALENNTDPRCPKCKKVIASNVFVGLS
jgi:hypothetical protein